MGVELRMPSLGMAMDEGKLSAWLVKQGDSVRRGQVVAEIESDKVAYEIESPADGRVGAILVAVDAIVPVGTTLATIETAHGSAQPGVEAQSQAHVPDAPRPSASAVGVSASVHPPGRSRLSPRARRLAESLGVDAASVTGSGADGWVVEEDIRQAAAALSQHASKVPPGKDADAPFVLRPLTLMRRTIAERVTASAREAPHFYLAVDVDGSALLQYRKANAAPLAARTGVKLTLTDLLVWVTADTLGAHRALNASYAPEGVREWTAVNVGLAVAVEDGLVVPVIREAHASSLADLARARMDLVSRARAGKLRAEDVLGGTFTISNLGGAGVDFFSSILNAGQAAILSVGTLRERPAIANGQVVSRPVMTLGLTIDHRVTDGAAGAAFLAQLKARIEQLQVAEGLICS